MWVNYLEPLQNYADCLQSSCCFTSKKLSNYLSNVAFEKIRYYVRISLLPRSGLEAQALLQLHIGIRFWHIGSSTVRTLRSGTVLMIDKFDYTLSMKSFFSCSLIKSPVILQSISHGLHDQLLTFKNKLFWGDYFKI